MKNEAVSANDMKNFFKSIFSQWAKPPFAISAELETSAREYATALSVDVAVREAQEHLREFKVFLVFDAPIDEAPVAQLVANLPKQTRAFVEEWYDVRGQYGDLQVGRKYLRKPELPDNVLIIGVDVAETNIYVLQDESVIIADEIGLATNDFEKWPTLYHLICYHHRLFQLLQ